MYEVLSVVALIAAAGAGGFAFAQHRHIKHLDATIAYMRGEPVAPPPRANGAVRIEHGSFRPAEQR